VIPAGLDLRVDRPGHLVPGQQLGGRLLWSGSVYQRSASPRLGVALAEHVRDVVEHEPLAVGVAQHAAVAAHRLGDEDALHDSGHTMPVG